VTVPATVAAVMPGEPRKAVIREVGHAAQFAVEALASCDGDGADLLVPCDVVCLPLKSGRILIAQERSALGQEQSYANAANASLLP